MPWSVTQKVCWECGGSSGVVHGCWPVLLFLPSFLAELRITPVPAGRSNHINRLRYAWMAVGQCRSFVGFGLNLSHVFVHVAMSNGTRCAARADRSFGYLCNLRRTASINLGIFSFRYLRQRCVASPSGQQGKDSSNGQKGSSLLAFPAFLLLSCGFSALLYSTS